MKKYVKNPIEVECIRWNGNNQDEIYKFYINNKNEEFDFKLDWNNGGLYIDTFYGKHKVEVGDYIIKGVLNELYPCKPEVFEKTYVSKSEYRYMKILRNISSYMVMFVVSLCLNWTLDENNYTKHIVLALTLLALIINFHIIIKKDEL